MKKHNCCSGKLLDRSQNGTRNHVHQDIRTSTKGLVNIRADEQKKRASAEPADQTAYMGSLFFGGTCLVLIKISLRPTFIVAVYLQQVEMDTVSFTGFERTGWSIISLEQKIIREGVIDSSVVVPAKAGTQ